MIDHTRTEKIGGDSIYFYSHPSQAGNRYDRAFSEGELILTEIDGNDLPSPINSDAMKKYYA